MRSDTTHPDYNDASAVLQTLSKSHPKTLTLRRIGQSARQRDIQAAIITAPDGNDDIKERVLVIAGQHGSEESGRAVALALIQYMLTDEALDIRAKQIVAVIPCVNPDGSILNTYRNADDIDIAHTYSFDQPPGTPEGKALVEFAADFVPDAFVDIHGLAGGSMKDRVWLPSVPAFYPEREYSTRIAFAMIDAAIQAGYPQSVMKPPALLTNAYGIGEVLSLRYKCMAFGLEAIERYYREPEWADSGLVRLKTLLSYGQKDAFGLGRTGYPSHLVAGDRMYGLAAHGETAASRRQNRVELARFLQNNFAVVDRMSDGQTDGAEIIIRSDGIKGENPPRFSVIASIKKPCRFVSVSWKGTTLPPDGAFGYELIDQPHALLVRVNINEPFGGDERRIIIRYESPYLRD